MKNAQSAIEYLVIIALTLGLIAPVTYIFFKFSTESSIELIYSQIEQIGSNIIDTARNVYYSGKGSKIVLDLNMPDDIKDIKILSNRELTFQIIADKQDLELVFFSSLEIPISSTDTSGDCQTNGNCALAEIKGPGKTKVKIEYLSDKIIISRTS